MLACDLNQYQCAFPPFTQDLPHCVSRFLLRMWCRAVCPQESAPVHRFAIRWIALKAGWLCVCGAFIKPRANPETFLPLFCSSNILPRQVNQQRRDAPRLKYQQAQPHKYTTANCESPTRHKTHEMTFLFLDFVNFLSPFASKSPQTTQHGVENKKESKSQQATSISGQNIKKDSSHSRSR
jgi:hypothetical protein